MMKTYINPQCDYIVLNEIDVLCSSGLANLTGISNTAKTGGNLDFNDILNRV